MSWEGFYLTEAERMAVWETAFCFFYQDDPELGYGEGALRGVTVYEAGA